MTAIEDVLLSTCVQPCCWRSGHVCIFSMWACTIQAYSFSCLNSVFRCSLLTHGLEEASHSHLRICALYSSTLPCTQRYRNSEKFHVRTWIHFGGLLQTQTRSASSHLSCLDGFIQQKQQNTYTQEIGEGGKGNQGWGQVALLWTRF